MKLDEGQTRGYTCVMKRLNDENIIPSSETCASAVMEALPQVMMIVRGEFRRLRPAELTVPQFRALGFIACHAGASLTAVAEHIGLSISSVSKLVAALAERGFVRHAVSRQDRRLAKLALTTRGKTALEAARQAMHASLTTAFTQLTDNERIAVPLAMNGLQRTILAQPDAHMTDTPGNEE